MLFLKKKDKNIRKLFKKFEITNLIYKFVKISLLCNLKYKKKYLNQIKKKIILSFQDVSKASKVKVVRRCIITNRSKSTCNKYGIERNTLRNLLRFGIIPGYRKAI